MLGLIWRCILSLIFEAKVEIKYELGNKIENKIKWGKEKPTCACWAISQAARPAQLLLSLVGSRTDRWARTISHMCCAQY